MGKREENIYIKNNQVLRQQKDGICFCRARLQIQDMQGMSDGRRKETTNDGGIRIKSNDGRGTAERGWAVAVDKDESVVHQRCCR